MLSDVIANGGTYCFWNFVMHGFNVSNEIILELLVGSLQYPSVIVLVTMFYVFFRMPCCVSICPDKF